ncbi:MAG TPA: lysophospholipid acyltransferase family protein [Smithellaceae bacterium]|nr:lysophospholipid acyltransferase family protein [Smithellaceae bacterium]
MTGNRRAFSAKEIKYFFLNQVLTSTIFFLLSLYAKTLRVQIEGKERILDHLDRGGRVIFASWHQRLFGGFFVPKFFQWTPCIMISQSRDGDFISKLVSRLGWIPVRGSSTRGGAKALKAMVQKVAENRIGVHIVDGPTGPPRVIKPGLLPLARSTDAPICPAVVSYETAWTFNSWDRFMIPRPFTRVLIRFGSLFDIPKDADRDTLEALRIRLEQTMNRAYESADNGWSSSGKCANPPI